MSKVLQMKSKVVPEFTMLVNKAQTEANMVIYGAIGDSFWDDAAVSADQFGKELDKLPTTVNKIILRLNSPGGSVFDGIAIYNRLKQHKATVHIYVDGIAASIASIISMAGDKIYMGEGSQMMIHKPLTMTWGNRDEHEKNIQILDGIENQMIGIYARKTGQKREEISNMLTGDYWMNPEKAVSLGFATDILEESENLRAAASMIMNAKWIDLRKAPEMKDTAKNKKRVEEIKNKIDGSIARIKNAALPKT